MAIEHETRYVVIESNPTVCNYDGLFGLSGGECIAASANSSSIIDYASLKNPISLLSLNAVHSNTDLIEEIKLQDLTGSKYIINKAAKLYNNDIATPKPEISKLDYVEDIATISSILATLEGESVTIIDVVPGLINKYQQMLYYLYTVDRYNYSTTYIIDELGYPYYLKELSISGDTYNFSIVRNKYIGTIETITREYSKVSLEITYFETRTLTKTYYYTIPAKTTELAEVEESVESVISSSNEPCVGCTDSDWVLISEEITSSTAHDTFIDTIESSFNIINSSIVAEEGITVSYSVNSSPNTVKRWIYLFSSNTYPSLLEYQLQETDINNFYPIIKIRDNAAVSALLPTEAKILDTFRIDPESINTIIDTEFDNPSDIKDAYISLAVNLLDSSQESLKYISRFFKQFPNMGKSNYLSRLKDSIGEELGTSVFRIKQEKFIYDLKIHYVDQQELAETRYPIGHYELVVLPETTDQTTVVSFEEKSEWVRYTFVTDQSDPCYLMYKDDLNSCTIQTGRYENTRVIVTTEYTYTVPGGIQILYQKGIGVLEELSIYGIVPVYAISGNTNSAYVHRTPITTGDISQNSAILLPLDKDIFKTLYFKERELLAVKSLHVTLHGHVLQDVEWYETPAFAVLVIAASTAFGAPQIGEAYSASVAIGATIGLSGAALVIFAITLTLLKMYLMDLVFKKLLKEALGSTNNDIIKILYVIIYTYVSIKFSNFSKLNAYKQAALIVKTLSTASTVATEVELEEKEEEYNRAAEEYEVISAKLDNLVTEDDNFKLGSYILKIIKDRDFDQYMSLKLKTISELELELIDKYVEMSISLPEANVT